MKDGITIIEESKSMYTVYYAKDGYCKITSTVTKQPNGKWRCTDARFGKGFFDWASKRTAIKKAKENAANIFHYLTRY